MFFKCLHGIFIKRCQKDDIGAVLRIKHPDHLQPADARHLNVEEQHVRTQFVHRTDGLNGVCALTHHLDITLLLQ